MNKTRDDMSMWVDEQLRAAIVHPAPDDKFVKQLRVRLDRKAAAMQAATTSRGRLGRRGWAFALGIAVMLMATSVAFVPTVIAAMKQIVIGYIPGIGLVEEESHLRVLAEPMSQTRDGITVTVEHTLLYDDRTVIRYQAESSDEFPFATSGASDRVCLEYARLRLPDGTMLMPDPMGNGKSFGLGYEFTTSFSAPVPLDVKHATLIIPCLLDTIRGTAPENWELALSFVPAPPDMDLVPVHDAAAAQSATDQGITVDLENIVAQGDSHIFIFSLSWNQGGENQPDLYPASIHVTDATGRTIRLLDDSGRPPMSQDVSEPFTFRTREMPAPGPLTLNLDAIKASFPVRGVSFTIEPGSDPQPNQVWALDEHLNVAGYEWDVTSAQVVSQDGMEGLEFSMQSTNPEDVMSVDLFDRQHPIFFGAGSTEGTTFTSSFYYEDGVPAGPITVTVGQVSALISGDWHIRWVPPAE